MSSSSQTQRTLHQPLLGNEINRANDEDGYGDISRDVVVDSDQEEQATCFDKDNVLCWFLLPAFFFSQIGLVYFLRENEVDSLYWPLVYFDVFVFLATAWLYRCSIIIDDGLQGMEIFYLFLPEILTDLTTLLVLFDRYTLAFVSLSATITVFAVLAIQALVRTCCARFSNDGPEEYEPLESEEGEAADILII